jgi:hypothetical protein
VVAFEDWRSKRPLGLQESCPGKQKAERNYIRLERGISYEKPSQGKQTVDWLLAVLDRDGVPMKKTILVGLAILAVSTSGALAAKKTTKPKAPATATTTNTGGAAPVMLGQVSAADPRAI